MNLCDNCRKEIKKPEPEPGSLPAFYESVECSGTILWINYSGWVVNGSWKPIFSEDRLTCSPPRWPGEPDSSAIYKWVGRAPSGGGDYNDVIENFLKSREKKEN